eukprot:599391-Rhodomonas_salina.1
MTSARAPPSSPSRLLRTSLYGALPRRVSRSVVVGLCEEGFLGGLCDDVKGAPTPVGSLLYYTGGGLISEHHGVMGFCDEVSSWVLFWGFAMRGYGALPSYVMGLWDEDAGIAEACLQ